MPVLWYSQITAAVYVLLLSSWTASGLTGSTVGFLTGPDHCSTDVELWQTNGEIQQIVVYANESSGEFQGISLRYGNASGPVRGESDGVATDPVILHEGYKLTGIFGLFNEYITAVGLTVTLPGGELYKIWTQANEPLDWGAQHTFEMNAPAGSRLVAIGGCEEKVAGITRIKALAAYWSHLPAEPAAVVPAPLQWMANINASQASFVAGGIMQAQEQNVAYTEQESLFTGPPPQITLYSDLAGDLTGLEISQNGSHELHGLAGDNAAPLDLTGGQQIVGVFGMVRDDHVVALGFFLDPLIGDQPNSWGMASAFGRPDSTSFTFLAAPGQQLASVHSLLSLKDGQTQVAALAFQWEDVEKPGFPPPPDAAAPVAGPPPSDAPGPPSKESPQPPPSLGDAPGVRSAGGGSHAAQAWIAGPVVGGIVLGALVCILVYVGGRRRVAAASTQPYEGSGSATASGATTSSPARMSPSKSMMMYNTLYTVD